MITAINFLMLESISTSDDDEMNTGIYKSMRLGTKMKHFIK